MHSALLLSLVCTSVPNGCKSYTLIFFNIFSTFSCCFVKKNVILKQKLTFCSCLIEVFSCVHKAHLSIGEKKSHLAVVTDNMSLLQRWLFPSDNAEKSLRSICRWVHCAKQWWNSMTLATILLCPTFEECHYCRTGQISLQYPLWLED